MPFLHKSEETFAQKINILKQEHIFNQLSASKLVKTLVFECNTHDCQTFRENTLLHKIAMLCCVSKLHCMTRCNALNV